MFKAGLPRGPISVANETCFQGRIGPFVMGLASVDAKVTITIRRSILNVDEEQADYIATSALAEFGVVVLRQVSIW
jgi:hypothetical protein